MSVSDIHTGVVAGGIAPHNAIIADNDRNSYLYNECMYMVCMQHVWTYIPRRMKQCIL